MEIHRGLNNMPGVVQFLITLVIGAVIFMVGLTLLGQVTTAMIPTTAAWNVTTVGPPGIDITTIIKVIAVILPIILITGMLIHLINPGSPSSSGRTQSDTGEALEATVRRASEQARARNQREADERRRSQVQELSNMGINDMPIEPPKSVAEEPKIKEDPTNKESSRWRAIED